MRLFLILYSIAATALAGSAIVAVLAAGMPGWEPIVGAAALGAVVSLPVTWVASKKIASL